MSDSAALKFTVDKQISRTFRSVDLSQPAYKLICQKSSTALSLISSNLSTHAAVSLYQVNTNCCCARSV